MVALKSTMRYLEVWHAVSRDLLGSLPKRKGFRLRKEICHQQVMVSPKRIQRLVEADEIAGYQLGSLVNELIEGMLPVGSWLPPDNRTSLIIDRMPLQIYMFAVALHIKLLQVRRQTTKIVI